MKVIMYIIKLKKIVVKKSTFSEEISGEAMKGLASAITCGGRRQCVGSGWVRGMGKRRLFPQYFLHNTLWFSKKA